TKDEVRWIVPFSRQHGAHEIAESENAAPIDRLLMTEPLQLQQDLFGRRVASGATEALKRRIDHRRARIDRRQCIRNAEAAVVVSMKSDLKSARVAQCTNVVAHFFGRHAPGGIDDVEPIDTEVTEANRLFAHFRDGEVVRLDEVDGDDESE